MWSKRFHPFRQPPHRNIVAEDTTTGTPLAGSNDKDTVRDRQESIHNGTYEASAEPPAKEAQEGVRRVEAITLSWGKTSLIVTYIS